MSNLLENKNYLNKEKSKKEIFLDATQLDYRTVPMLSQTSAICNLSAYLNIYSREGFFLSKWNSFKGLRKNGGFDYIPYEGFS